MQTNLLYRPSQTLAQVWLAPGESIVAESGAMVGMSTNVAVQTQSGGIIGGLKRIFGGESFFRNTFTAQGGQGEVLLATPLAGDMVVLDVGAHQYFVQNSCYVASTPGVSIDTKGGGVKGFFSGAGFFVLATSGQGQLVVGSFGALEPLSVKGSAVVDTGHVVAWQSTLSYEVSRAGGGLVASILSGEGLVCTFSGTGLVYVQTRNVVEYGQNIGAMLPSRSA
jgi:uncharacterized protein (TIGR00266 family)